MAFHPMTKRKWIAGDDRPMPAGSRLPSPPDLECMEDGLDKDSPDVSSSSSSSSTLPRGAAARPAGAAAASGSAARLPTPSERAQLRRARPADLACRGSRPSSFPREGEERMDTLFKMFRAQRKCLPAGVSGSAGSRALCHTVSPFVAERRGLFVAWESQMATFLRYSRDTVAVALNYFDRYTCAMACSPTLAQAVAATALHVAAKFEEIHPASLRELLKFTPVFNPDHLLRMEMSLLKVLKWDLRPVTVYDFVRAFCEILVPGARPPKPSAATADGKALSQPQPRPPVAVTLQAKEDKERELERLRIVAEDIADLASFDVAFVDFLPSTLATAALLLSVSRGTPAPPLSSSTSTSTSTSLAPTSHTDVLDACWKDVRGVAPAAAAAADAAEAKPDDGVQEVGQADDCGVCGVPLRRVQECVELLGTCLSQRYPTAAAAAEAAAESIARYAGWPLPIGRGAATAAVATAVAAKEAQRVSTSTIAVAKNRRCATPTGVDGIMHIELDTMRREGAGVDDDDAGADGEKQQQGKLSSTQEALSVKASTISTRSDCGASVDAGANNGDEPAAAAAAAAASQHPQHRRRPTAFTTTAATKATTPTAALALQQQQQQLKQQALVGADSFVYTDEDIAFARASKRSADALGHSETGSGFSAPSSRCGRVGTGGGAKAAKLSRTPPALPVAAVVDALAPFAA